LILVDASQHHFSHLEGIGENVRGTFFGINVMNWKQLHNGQEFVQMQLQTNDFVI